VIVSDFICIANLIGLKGSLDATETLALYRLFDNWTG
jgi:hypothetical protein